MSKLFAESQVKALGRDFFKKIILYQVPSDPALGKSYFYFF